MTFWKQLKCVDVDVLNVLINLIQLTNIAFDISVW